MLYNFWSVCANFWKAVLCVCNSCFFVLLCVSISLIEPISFIAQSNVELSYSHLNVKIAKSRAECNPEKDIETTCELAASFILLILN